ncbi:hypothetical protein CY35_04G050200 [Sphagnum magellanicum]|nr:hypothetical protein CY35_04G050200 [Sphagnum magellanicum]
MADSSSVGPAAQEEWSSVVSAEAVTRAPPPHPTITRPLLDLSGAAIGGSEEDHNPTIVLPNQSAEVSHFAIDLGGSLIKLVYFSRAQQEAKTTTTEAESNKKKLEQKRSGFLAGLRRRGGFPILGGRLHFVKFESSKLNDCLAFIKSKRLHRCSNGIEGLEALGATATAAAATAEKSSNSSSSPTTTMPEKNGEKNGVIKATGGGAFKYAELFKEKLGVTFDKEDEMQCLVSGANFLLRAIRDEAFTHHEGHKQFVQLDQNELFPYLLVNIGSGVSMIKVDEEGQYERVSGTNVGGGTFWGLGKLLTKCKSFDEILELSQGGDNSAVDMLVGDIYGGLDYSKIGLSASTIASSFGKVIAENKDLSDYRKEDIVLSLLRMISYNIGQVAYLNALRYGLKRIFFSGFFIRGHAYTMDTMSFAIRFWSKGDAQAMFLRHEGFLGALGAFLSYDKYGLANLTSHHCVERFPMGAPYVGGEVHGPPIRDLNEKITWMEKFMQKGIEITAPIPISLPGTTGLGGFERPLARSESLRSDSSAALNVGVLHLDPSLEPFPLLADPKNYEPNTVDLSDQTEREYWLRILFGNLPDLVEKAVASEGGTDDARRRGDAFARAFKAHLARLREEPAAYGKLGLANLLEMREECLREFHFHDVYMAIKERENEAALTVLPDLLAELDSLEPAARMLALIEGVLAANIFDWGSRACVELYHSGTIIEIYRMSRNKMKRPLRVDNFEAFQKKFIGSAGNEGSEKLVPHKRALLFVDNSGADVVLGMLPLARELLRRGTEVVLVANSLPAINDVTAVELPAIVAAAAKHCDTLRRAATAGGLLVDVVGDDGLTEDVAAVPVLTVVENGCGSPCIDFRQVSSELAVIAQDADLMVLEGMGRALHTNYNARFQCDVLKLAMVKNQRLAEQLLNGSIYDCVCRYEPANYGSSALAN